MPWSGKFPMQDELKHFWNNLQRIQNILLKSDKEFADYLGIDHTQFIKKKKSGKSALPVNCMYEFADKLNFHFEDLLTSDFNTKPISSLLEGNFSLLEKYTVATYSQTRQTGNVLNYLERSRGERSKIDLIRKFQLNEDYIFSGKNSVNALLLTDITTYLRKTYQFSDQEFLKIGQSTPLLSMNSDLANALSNKKDIYEILEYFFDELCTRFDKNFAYRILKIEGDYAYIEAKPHKRVIEELGINGSDFGNELTCLTRMGVISSITWFKFNHFARIKKITSAYSGDSTNIYIFDISQFRNLSSFTNTSLLHTKPIYH